MIALHTLDRYERSVELFVIDWLGGNKSGASEDAMLGTRRTRFWMSKERKLWSCGVISRSMSKAMWAFNLQSVSKFSFHVCKQVTSMSKILIGSTFFLFISFILLRNVGLFSLLLYITAPMAAFWLILEKISKAIDGMV